MDGGRDGDNRTGVILFCSHALLALPTYKPNRNNHSWLCGNARPIGFVIAMSWGFSRLSYFTLLVLFLVYAAIMGASLSFIFLVYTRQSVFNMFLTAAAMFGTMGLVGSTTKADLTKMGTLLLMVLLGIIIASLLNMFLKSDSFSYTISFISVIVFCGLTAWDIQKLKRMAMETETGYETGTKSKLSILGALTL